jgi:hypothetical protein
VALVNASAEALADHCLLERGEHDGVGAMPVGDLEDNGEIAGCSIEGGDGGDNGHGHMTW